MHYLKRGYFQSTIRLQGTLEVSHKFTTDLLTYYSSKLIRFMLF